METLEELERERLYWQGLNESFKTVINSYYGYLGSSIKTFFFSDVDAAEKVTLTGQEIVKEIAELIEQSKGEVIEIDTDGVFFVPPEEIETEEDEENYITSISDNLPKGIKLAHDGRYKTMISIRKKNYVLLDYKGKKKFKGNSLRSRSDEKYGRDFLSSCVEFLLEDKIGKISDLYHSIVKKLTKGEIDPSEIARRERISEKTLNSKAKERLRSNVGDMKLGDNIWVYEREDRSLGKIEEYKGDANLRYYIDKLQNFIARLEPVLGDKINSLCPPVSKRMLEHKKAGQLSFFEDE